MIAVNYQFIKLGYTGLYNKQDLLFKRIKGRAHLWSVRNVRNIVE